MSAPPSFADLNHVRRCWPEVLSGIDPLTLREQRWFHGRTAARVELTPVDQAFLDWPENDELAVLNIVRLQTDDEPQLYFLPMVILPERAGLPALGRLTVAGRSYTAADAALSRRFAAALLVELGRGNAIPGESGRFAFHPAGADAVRAVRPLAGDSSNTVLHLRRDGVQKMVRRLWPGTSREVDLGLALKGRPFIPDFHGHLSYAAADGATYTLSLWQEYLPNRGSLWETLVIESADMMRAAIAPGQTADPGWLLTQWLNEHTPAIQALAHLTAQLHLALCDASPSVPFAAGDLAPITVRIQKHLAEAGRCVAPEPPGLWAQTAELAAHLAVRLAAAEMGRGIITHGDYHLDQILVTEHGYAVLDLEGEPLADPAERARATTPLRDLAGMVRSLSYVGQAARLAALGDRRLPQAQVEILHFLADRFVERCTKHLIAQYAVKTAELVPGLIPQDPVVFMDLLDLCRLEKVAYELTYEAANRPDWVAIPLAGLRSLLRERRVTA